MTFTPSAFTAAQTSKAVEAIEDGAVKHIAGRFGGSFRVVAADGTTVYQVAADFDFCSCAARGRCYHLLAAWLFVEGLDALKAATAA